MSRLAIVGAAVVVVAPSVFGQAQIVYDNTENVDNRQVFYSSHEYGDEIYLAPGYREVSHFSFEYFADFNPATSPNASFKVHFFMNDGSDANTNPAKQPVLRPGTLLWESASVALQKGFGLVTLDVPDILVPTKFTWTVQFSGVTGATGNQAALVLADPPTIGQPLANGRFGSYWDAWIDNDPNNADSWSLFGFGFNSADPHANFYAKVETVPEPSTWLMLTAGAGLLLSQRRRLGF